MKLPVLSHEERGLLQRQFESSLFAKQSRAPKQLAVFDFDNTLFFSPQLSPTIWDSKVLKIITNENVYGPGWWRDVRSMELGKDLLRTCWKGYWNEDIVQKARACISDPQIMTVVLTGRRHHPFYPLISAMLEAKELEFDLIGLRPDPEDAPEYHWKVGKQGMLDYHTSRSVFRSTMQFKECFLYSLLQRLSSIREITMWDDRVHHLKAFRAYLGRLKKARMIDRYDVIEVPSLRPKYNPEWERQVVTKIINSHNLALRAKQRGVKFAKISDEAPRDHMDAPDDYLALKTTRVGDSIELTRKSIDRLRKVFEPLFRQQMKQYTTGMLKIHPGAEEPLFFGESFRVKRNYLALGEKVTIEVQRVSDLSTNCWMILDVQVNRPDGQHYNDILPLYYKPSEEEAIFKRNEFSWCSLTDDRRITLEGTMVKEKRITITADHHINQDVAHDEIKKILNRGSILQTDNEIIRKRSRSPEDHVQKKRH